MNRLIDKHRFLMDACLHYLGGGGELDLCVGALNTVRKRSCCELNIVQGEIEQCFIVVKGKCN